MGVVTIQELESGLNPIRPIKEYVWKKVLKLDEGQQMIHMTIGPD